MKYDALRVFLTCIPNSSESIGVAAIPESIEGVHAIGAHLQLYVEMSEMIGWIMQLRYNSCYYLKSVPSYYSPCSTPPSTALPVSMRS